MAERRPAEDRFAEKYEVVDGCWLWTACLSSSGHVPKGTLARLERAESALARVLDVCDRIWDDARYAHKYGFLEAVREVRYALEGGNDE